MVFITRSSPVQVTNFELRFDENGQMQSSLSLATGYLMYPQWLHLAVALAREAKNASIKTDRAWQSDDGKRQQDALEREVRYVAGAVTASVASIDGLYGWLRHIEAKEPNRTVPKRKRTARFAQVSELIRVSFKIDEHPSSRIRKHLKTMFDLRDQAIHPNPVPSTPVKHPRLMSLMNQNLANFHADNAIGCAQSAANIIDGVFEVSRSDDERVKKHIQQLKPEITKIRRKANSLSK